jgi:dynein heavy chain 1
MKSEAVKDRHWRIIMKQLNVQWNFADLTVGQVLDIQPLKHAKAIEDVMRQAQGENGLEQYLREIREEWSGYEVELGNFQNKTRVVKGWDELFAKVSSLSDGDFI